MLSAWRRTGPNRLSGSAGVGPDHVRRKAAACGPNPVVDGSQSRSLFPHWRTSWCNTSSPINLGSRSSLVPHSLATNRRSEALSWVPNPPEPDSTRARSPRSPRSRKVLGLLRHPRNLGASRSTDRGSPACLRPTRRGGGTGMEAPLHAGVLPQGSSGLRARLVGPSPALPASGTDFRKRSNYPGSLPRALAGRLGYLPAFPTAAVYRVGPLRAGLSHRYRLSLEGPPTRGPGARGTPFHGRFERLHCGTDSAAQAGFAGLAGRLWPVSWDVGEQRYQGGRDLRRDRSGVRPCVLIWRSRV
jgi:hypothetical protein